MAFFFSRLRGGLSLSDLPQTFFDYHQTLLLFLLTLGLCLLGGQVGLLLGGELLQGLIVVGRLRDTELDDLDPIPIQRGFLNDDRLPVLSRTISVARTLAFRSRTMGLPSGPTFP